MIQGTHIHYELANGSGIWAMTALCIGGFFYDADFFASYLMKLKINLGLG